jgi:hypothetical protein
MILVYEAERSQNRTETSVNPGHADNHLKIECVHLDPVKSSSRRLCNYVP